MSLTADDFASFDTELLEQGAIEPIELLED
jgi:hypothetical protein